VHFDINFSQPKDRDMLTNKITATLSKVDTAIHSQGVPGKMNSIKWWAPCMAAIQLNPVSLL